MKLLSCYIENYGKLHQFSYDFDDKLNIILQDNGWGKSTFASFIKAMLFGLPATRRTDLDENERLKYTPWQQGPFGGWLKFEINGKKYQIERFFEKTAAKDRTTLYDLETNQILPDDDFVQKQLGINADTFMRSTFIQHGLISNADDESIKEKLGKLIENQEVESVSQVDARLKEYQTNIEHLRGSGGKLNSLKKELESTQDSIEKCKSAKISADALTTEYNENAAKIQNISQKLAELRAKLQAVNDERIEEEKRKHYESLQAELNKIKAEIAEITEFFHGKPPKNDEISALLETQTKINTEQNSLDELNKNNISQKIEKLNAYFKNGVPTEDEIAEIKAVNGKLRELDNNIRISQNIYEHSSKTNSKNAANKAVGIGGISAGIVFLILGLILFLSNTILLVAFIVAGVFFSSIGAYFVIKPAKNDNIPANITSKSNLENYQKEYAANQKIISNFVEKYGEESKDFAEAIYNIDAQRKRLAECNLEQHNVTERKNDLIKGIQKKKTFLSDFYSQFYPNPANFHACYTDATARIQHLEILKKQSAAKQREINTFTSENQISYVKKAEISENIDEIKKKIEVLEREREQISVQSSTINSRLLNASSVASGLCPLENYAIELRENIEKLSKDLTTVKTTREFLEKAKNSLTSKYLTPLTDAFREYSRKIVGGTFDKISIDTSLNVLLEEQGGKKESKYFSHGGRDVIELCMRLALAKTLFNNETPPLIMDDPFCNLDDTKTTRALELVSDLTEEFQIIYLVCHSSRAQK